MSSYDRVAQSEAQRANPRESAGASTDRAAYRAYNNFVKATLIRTALQRWTADSASGGIAFLDLASGRGGDLAKILVPNRAQSVPVTRYAALDISSESVAEARRRLAAMQAKASPGCTMDIDVADVFDVAGEWRTRECLAARRYHVVSMQFALHYGCSSLQRLRQFLGCVSAALVDGGWFIGTTVDGEALRRRLQMLNSNLASSNDTGAHGAAPFCISFAAGQQGPDAAQLASAAAFPLGLAYRFQLDALVDDVEYSVPWSVLCAEAAAAGLDAVSDHCLNMYEGYKSFYVPQGDIRPPLTDGDVALVSFYVTFAFCKRGATPSTPQAPSE